MFKILNFAKVKHIILSNAFKNIFYKTKILLKKDYYSKF